MARPGHIGVLAGAAGVRHLSRCHEPPLLLSAAESSTRHNGRRAIDFLWILLAAGGLLLLLPIAHVRAGIDPIGALFALGAGACWAMYIVFGQRTGADHGARSVALGSIISATFTVPLGVATAGKALFTASVLIPGFGVAVLSTALPYTLEMIALTRLPARTFGILMSIEPAFGALFGYLYLHELLTGSQWLAIALIIVASIGATATIQQSVTENPAPV